MAIPDNFVMPDAKLLDPNRVGGQKPVYGNLGSQYVEFSMHKRYSGSASVDAGKEVYQEIEICKIQNDKFTKAAVRVKDLTPTQKRDMANLYQQWRTQKDSTDTRIMAWEAISESDKAFLIGAGVHTVEQLDAFVGEDLFRLGPGAKEYKDAAKRHMITKEGEKKAEQSEEIKLILEENRKLREMVEKREAEYFAKQAQETPKKSFIKKKELTAEQGA